MLLWLYNLDFAGGHGDLSHIGIDRLDEKVFG